MPDSSSSRAERNEDKEITKRFPEYLAYRIEIELKNVERRVATTDYPRGHHSNPMADDEIEAKFRDLVRRQLTPKGVDGALSALWQLDTAVNLDAFSTP